MNNLNLTSSPTSGSTNFSTINQQFHSNQLLGLMSNTTYYYQVRATNSHGSSQTMIFDVTTQMARKCMCVYLCICTNQLLVLLCYNFIHAEFIIKILTVRSNEYLTSHGKIDSCIQN